MVHIIDNNAVNNLMTINQKTRDQLTSLIMDMDKIALQVVANPSIQNSLQTASKDNDTSNYFDDHWDEKLDTVALLTSLNGPNLLADRISVYTRSGDYVSTGIFPDSLPYIYSIMGQQWFIDRYIDIQNLRGARYMWPPSWDLYSKSPKKVLFSLSREIKDLDFSYGFVEIQLAYKHLEVLTRDYDSTHYSHYILTPDETIVYPYDSTPSNNAHAQYYYSKIPADNPSGYIKARNPYSKETEVITYSYCEKTDWILISVQSLKALREPLNFIVYLLLLTGGLLIITALILILIISNHLTKPLRNIRESINAVTLKKLSIDLDEELYHNEFKLLNDSFKQMFKRLQSSMDEVMVLKTSELNARILALQSQMNPHFIYNTLAVINASAIEENYDKTSQLCNQLSDLLRYSSNYKEGHVYIKDEVSNGKNYLQLMKFRFEDYFTYSFDVDADLENKILLPRLTLQPLLENCFSHGFKYKRPPWDIQVHIYSQDDYWFLEVIDNGTGFTNNQLVHLEQQLENFKKLPYESITNLSMGGLGLTNTLLRLYHCYGSELIYDFNSDGEHTCIKIGGPIDDTSTDC